MEEQQLDKKDLKIQALLEKMGSMSARHENEIADLRVELTLITRQLEEFQKSAEKEKAAAKPAK